MKNAIKIMAALKQAFPGHEITSQHMNVSKMENLYFDGTYIGRFDSEFLNQDADNPEIEIKIKAPLKYFTDYLDNTYKNEKLSEPECIIRNAIGKGVRKWAEGSQHKAESEVQNDER